LDTDEWQTAPPPEKQSQPSQGAGEAGPGSDSFLSFESLKDLAVALLSRLPSCIQLSLMAR